jgi:pre-mRNA-splicing factor SYF1
MYDPSQRENFAMYLEEKGLYHEAAKQLVFFVDDSHYVSPNATSKHQLWMKLCDICATHLDSASCDINVEPIIRSGITKFSDEVGRLWSRLADYYVHQGLFDKARDIYDEALGAVVTVKDFTTVFDKYVKVEEKVLATKLQWLEELEEDLASADAEVDAGHESSAAGEHEETQKEKMELEQEIEIRLARIEHLLTRRPLLLNSVVLRQNPHNVFEC